MRIIVAIFLMLAMTGCHHITVRSNITVFHDLPARSEPIKYVALPYKEQLGSLEYRAYARQIEAELNKNGFVEVPIQDAEVILFFDYGIDSGKEVISSYPIIGQTGTSSSYTSGTVTSYGSYATYSGTTYNTPMYGVVGTGIQSDTVFSRFLRLELADKAALANGKVKKIYEATVTSAGSSSQIAAVMPTMIETLFEDFPGKSGSTRSANRRAMPPPEIGVAMLPSPAGTQIDTQWKPLFHPTEGQGIIGYSTAVFVKSDLPLPMITKLTGEAKFIDGGNVQTEGVRLGYKVTIDVGPVNLAKVPKKYLRKKLINVGGATVTQLPITQVSHDVHFEFTLKDKDGFKLLETQSKPHTIESGKTNTFQDIAIKSIPENIAARTAEIVFYTIIDQCVTCESE